MYLLQIIIDAIGIHEMEKHSKNISPKNRRLIGFHAK